MPVPMEKFTEKVASQCDAMEKGFMTFCQELISDFKSREDEFVLERNRLMEEVFHLQRESSRKEWLRKANQDSALILRKDNDGLSGSTHQNKENQKNTELDFENGPPDGLNPHISKSSQPSQDDHVARSSRETQYRDLYLRVKADYEKLSKAYLKLKQSHVASKNMLRNLEMSRGDRLNEASNERADRDATALENTSYPDMSRTLNLLPRSSPRTLNLLPRSSPDPTRDVSNGWLLPMTEPFKEKQTSHRGAGANGLVEEKVYNEQHRQGDSSDQIVRNLASSQEDSEAKHQLTKSAQKATNPEEVKTSKDKRVSSEESSSKNDSDEPIVISERSLKRKRPGAKQHATSSALKDPHIPNETLTGSVRIKSEPELSSPHSTHTHQTLAKLNDSIDLDDVGNKTVTPRKRRRVWPCLLGKEHIGSTTKEEDDTNSLAEAAKRTNPPRSPKGQLRRHPRTPNSSLHNWLLSQNRIHDSEATLGQTPRSVLATIDPNRRMLPSTSDPTLNQQCAIQTARNFYGGEFGANHGLPSLDSHRRTKPKWLAQAEDFFSDYDDEESVERPNSPVSSNEVKREMKDEETLSEAREPPRDQPESKTTKWVAQGAAIFRDYDDEVSVEGSNLPVSSSGVKIEKKDQETISEAREPPRDQPESKFYPEDFRLNPQHNQGLDYAYREVIRGHEARKCLNGCTRPGCCGTLFRKAIEIGGYITPQRTRLSHAINGDEADQDEDEVQDLLDEYAGDGKHGLKSMPEAERKKLLIHAQTENFAKQYGKHRCAYGRSSTPPGFWNTDMPTTQEEIENRKCANQMEREKVAHRYREAMRPNGRYMLREK